MSAHSIDLTVEAPLNPDAEERAHMRVLISQATILLEDGHRRNKGPLVALFRSLQEILEGGPTTVPQESQKAQKPQTGQKRGRDCDPDYDPEPKKKATHTCSVCGSAKGYGRSLCPYGCRPVSKSEAVRQVALEPALSFVEEVD